MRSISELPEHWQEWYQEWDASVPENEKRRRLTGDLLSKPGSTQSYGAAFELFLYSLFNNMGLSPDFQPEINGVNRPCTTNPDFRRLSVQDRFVHKNQARPLTRELPE